jgi:hypothetical protein
MTWPRMVVELELDDDEPELAGDELELGGDEPLSWLPHASRPIATRSVVQSIGRNIPKTFQRALPRWLAAVEKTLDAGIRFGPLSCCCRRSGSFAGRRRAR